MSKDLVYDKNENPASSWNKRMQQKLGICEIFKTPVNNKSVTSQIIK